MIILTKQQRKSLFYIFRRDFPSWVSPFKRESLSSHEVVKVSSVQYRRFRNRVRPGPGCVMVPWKGMWLGIEPDGYTHS